MNDEPLTARARNLLILALGSPDGLSDAEKLEALRSLVHYRRDLFERNLDLLTWRDQLQEGIVQ